MCCRAVRGAAPVDARPQVRRETGHAFNGSCRGRQPPSGRLCNTPAFETPFFLQEQAHRLWSAVLVNGTGAALTLWCANSIGPISRGDTCSDVSDPQLPGRCGLPQVLNARGDLRPRVVVHQLATDVEMHPSQS
jgi:hypothetical protein